MTSLALVSIAGVIALARVWSLRGSRTALMTLAIPAALLPIVVGAISGAWNYEAEFTRIGESGSGGGATVIGVIRDWFEALIAGAVGGVAILATAVVLSLRQRTYQVAARPAGLARAAAAVVATVVVVAIVALPIVVARSERAAVGLLVQLVPIVSPASQLDFGYPEIRTMQMPELLAQLEQDLRIVTMGGRGLLVVLGVTLLLGNRLRSLNGSAATWVPALTAIVVAIAVAGVWYSLHAHSFTQVLDQAARL